jgi:ABC-2 type transport system permease protein
MSNRLSTLAAALVVARRDFTAILFSRSFLFFLLGPLFPIVVAVLAGGVGAHIQQSATPPQLGLAMSSADVDAILQSRRAFADQLGDAVPPMIVIARVRPGEGFDARGMLATRKENIAAVLTGSLSHPELTGTREQIEEWRGPVGLIAAAALHGVPGPVPAVALHGTASSTASERQGHVATAQAAQTLLFLLTMVLAGMVLSNLVEEKANKVIEVLAAAIPMDAVFFGKLFAMLGISFVGIAVWGTAVAGFIAFAGSQLPVLPAPAVGWPMMIALGVAYFAMAYLLLGSVFLAIGSLATTVREVQTLSMPVTMLQLVIFFLASFAMSQPRSATEIGAVVFPFSSPFAMVARAAQEPGFGQHLAALAWQALWVILLVRGGSRLFRKRVMKSGPGTSKRNRKSRKAAAATA